MRTWWSLPVVLLLGCASETEGHGPCYRAEGEACINGVQSLTCATDQCELKDSSGNLVLSGVMRVRPGAALHLRPALKVSVDEVHLTLTDARGAPIEDPMLRVTVDGVLTTSLPPFADRPRIKRFAVPRAETRPTSVDIGVAASMSEGNVVINLLDTKATCENCPM